MTPNEIQAARARCEAATPGPWGHSPRLTGAMRNDALVVALPDADEPRIVVPKTARKLERVASCGRYVTPGGTFLCNRNADFIAAARTDLPRALDALEFEREQRIEFEANEIPALEARVESLTAEVERLKAERDAHASQSAKSAWDLVTAGRDVGEVERLRQKFEAICNANRVLELEVRHAEDLTVDACRRADEAEAHAERAWQRVESLTALLGRAEAALADLLGGESACGAVHHAKPDRHSALEPCPVLARYDALLRDMAAAGEARDEATRGGE